VEMSDPSLTIGDLNYVAERLSALPSRELGESEPVVIGLIDVPGKGVFLTKELFQSVAHNGRQTPNVWPASSKTDIEGNDRRLGS